MTTRYSTPLKFTDGNGKEQRTKLVFEMDPIELMDWTFENPTEANMLQMGLTELRDIETENSRDLTREEVRTMLMVIKILADLSAGNPTDDGLYFIKDKNWTDSYAYRGFRLFLMTHPKEVQQFLMGLLDNDVMEKFSGALEEANNKAEAEVAADLEKNKDSGQHVADKMAKREQLQRELSQLD